MQSYLWTAEMIKSKFSNFHKAYTANGNLPDSLIMAAIICRKFTTKPIIEKLEWTEQGRRQGILIGGGKPVR